MKHLKKYDGYNISPIKGGKSTMTKTKKIVVKHLNEYFHNEESDTDYDTIIDDYTERLDSIKSEVRDMSYEDLAGYNTSNLYDMVIEAENYMNDAQDETAKNKMNDLWSKLDEAYRQIEDMQYLVSNLDNLKNSFY